MFSLARVLVGLIGLSCVSSVAADFSSDNVSVHVYSNPAHTNTLTCVPNAGLPHATCSPTNQITYLASTPQGLFFDGTKVSVVAPSDTAGQLIFFATGAINLLFPRDATIAIFDGAEIALDGNDYFAELFPSYSDSQVVTQATYVTGALKTAPTKQAATAQYPYGYYVFPGYAAPNPTSIIVPVQNGFAGLSGIGYEYCSTLAANYLKSPKITHDANNDLTVDIGAAAFDPNQFCTISYSYESDIGVKGDPQFTGFRGQSFQVHGTSGSIYNVISTPTLQYNALFSYLESGKCRSGTLCFSHPGNYFGEVGLMLTAGEQVKRFRMVAGDVDEGMKLIVDGVETPVSAAPIVFGNSTVSYSSPFELLVDTPEYSMRVQNSDHFLNQDVSISSSLLQRIVDDKRASKIGVGSTRSLPHGLLGQTWNSVTYNNRWKHIEGQLFSYMVSDGLFGTEFEYNRFQA